MAYVLADYDASTFGTKFFEASNSGTSVRLTSYHGKTSGDVVYCGLLLFQNPTRLGTLMLSLSPFSQCFTNTRSDGSSPASGTSTATLVSGYDDLYGYLVTNASEAYPAPYYITSYTSYVPLYNDVETFINEVYSGSVHHPITYRLTNCTAPAAPTEASVGSTVTVPFQFPDGYGFPNPTTDVYVYNNGVLVPSSYANNVLTFTMPDPS